MDSGTTIDGRFRLDAVLGEGAFGIVWKAWDLRDERVVAVKFLKATDAEMRHRFTREAEILSRLRHPNCVAIHSSGVADAGPYLVMEHLAGVELAELREPPLAIPFIEEIARQLADVLAYAHRHGVIHRDLKPENILLVAENGRQVIKVVDFGIAKISAPQLPDLTKTGEMLGTPYYMSPEQVRGSRHVGPASDQYALGVILYELIEGRRPFDGATALGIVLAHLTDAPPPITRPDCPAYLVGMVGRLLQKSPTDRYVDMTAVLRHLERPHEAPVVAVPGVDKPRGRSWGVALVVACLAVASAPTLTALLDRPPVEQPISHEQVANALKVINSAPEAQPAATRDASTGASDPADVAASVDSAVHVDGGHRFPAGACDGEPVAYGLRERTHRFEFETRRLTRFVPPSYDSKTPHPVILVLRGGNEDTGSFLRSSGLPEVARAHGVVLIAPETMDDYNYNDGIVEKSLDLLDREFVDLCLDPRRVFVVGHSHGAVGAERLACEPWVRAVGVSSYGRNIDDHTAACPVPHPVPLIALWPLKSPLHPVDGGDPAGCRKRTTAIAPLKDMEQRFADARDCTSPPATARAQPGGRCAEWSCRVPYVSCHLDGGHGWPNTPGRRAGDFSFGMQRYFERCSGEPANFESAATIWGFFASLDQ